MVRHDQQHGTAHLQASVGTAYAAVLAQVAQPQPAVSEAQAVGVQVLRDRPSYDALRAVSEVSRNMEFKIRQRYIPQGVYDCWHELRGQARPRLVDFEKCPRPDAHSTNTFSAKGPGNGNQGAQRCPKLTELLKGVVACVVNRAEHLSTRSPGADPAPTRRLAS